MPNFRADALWKARGLFLGQPFRSWLCAVIVAPAAMAGNVRKDVPRLGISCGEVRGAISFDLPDLE
jgi:hypothetical protein